MKSSKNGFCIKAMTAVLALFGEICGEETEFTRVRCAHILQELQLAGCIGCIAHWGARDTRNIHDKMAMV